MTSEELKERVSNILDYMWEDELEDFEEHMDEYAGCEDSHIFSDMVALSGHFNNHTKTPQQIIAESRGKEP